MVDAKTSPLDGFEGLSRDGVEDWNTSRDSNQGRCGWIPSVATSDGFERRHVPDGFEAGSALDGFEVKACLMESKQMHSSWIRGSTCLVGSNQGLLLMDSNLILPDPSPIGDNLSIRTRIAPKLGMLVSTALLDVSYQL